MKYLLLVCFLAGFCLRGSALAEPTLPRATPESQGISSAALLPLIEEAEQKKLGLHGIMIVRHGRVVAEGWWAPYAATEPHMLFSLSKSFTSTAVGLAQAEGKLSINDPILKFFPEDAPASPSANLKAMRIADLLRMSTGHHAADIDPFPFMAQENLVKNFLSRPVTDKPGTHFHYNTAATYMLSAIVQKVTGQTVLDYLRPRLFEPLGIANPAWEASAQGISFGGFGLSARTEDLARFGQLYLQRGEWEGRRLIPADWVDAATSRQTSNGSSPDSDWDQGYGYQFWRCIPGFYRGDGAFGQFCIVMPQYDTVVAINSGTSDLAGVMKLLWRRLLPELRPAALPADDAAATQLREKLLHLRLPVVMGDNSNATASQYSAKTFRFDANPLKLETVTTGFTDQGASFQLEIGGQKYALPAVAGGWTKGPSLPLGGVSGLTPVAATGAWTAPDTYTLRVAYYRTPFIMTAQLHFANGEMLLDYATNVGSGAAKAPTLTGRVQ